MIRPGYFVDVAAGVGFTPSVARANLSHQIIINKGRKSSFFMFGAGGTYEWHKTDTSAFTETETQLLFQPCCRMEEVFQEPFGSQRLCQSIDSSFWPRFPCGIFCFPVLVVFLWDIRFDFTENIISGASFCAGQFLTQLAVA